MSTEAVTAGEIVVTRSDSAPTELYFPLTANKSLRVVPALAVTILLMTKLAAMLKQMLIRLVEEPRPEDLLGILSMAVLFVLMGRIAMFMVYLACPRRLIIDDENGDVELHYSLFLRRRFGLRGIRSVDLATYDFHGRWLGFCCLSFGQGIPRLYLSSTVQGTARSDQAMTAGRPLADVLVQELSKPMKRYDNVKLRWFRGWDG